MRTVFEELYERTEAILRELNSDPDADRLALLVNRRSEVLPEVQSSLESGELPTAAWVEAWSELESRVRAAMKRELNDTATALRQRLRIRASTVSYSNGHAAPRFVDSAV